MESVNFFNWPLRHSKEIKSHESHAEIPIIIALKSARISLTKI